jgi:hypothetical protein
MSLTRPGLEMLEVPDTAKVGDHTMYDAETQSLALKNPNDPNDPNTEIFIVDLRYNQDTGELIADLSNGTDLVVSGFLTAETIVSAGFGKRGDRGATGPRGEPGRDGKDGLDGPPGCQGAKGDSGPIGARGDTGPAGLKGDTGSIGPKGDQGERGARGDPGIQGPTGSRGARGIQGLQGPIGPQGEKGDRGIQGIKGNDGERGETGPMGPQGEKGDTGPVGPKGDVGCVGAPGSDGPRGDQGDPGKIQQVIAGTNVIVEDLGNGVVKVSCCVGATASGDVAANVAAPILANQLNPFVGYTQPLSAQTQGTLSIQSALAYLESIKPVPMSAVASSVGNGPARASVRDISSEAMWYTYTSTFSFISDDTLDDTEIGLTVTTPEGYTYTTSQSHLYLSPGSIVNITHVGEAYTRDSILATPVVPALLNHGSMTLSLLVTPK